MSTKRQKHFWHYIVYAVLFGGGLVLIYLTRNDAGYQELSLIMIAVLYFFWSMVHQSVHHKLNRRIAVEYLLIVILGTILALFLFRA